MLRDGPTSPDARHLSDVVAEMELDRESDVGAAVTYLETCDFCTALAMRECDMCEAKLCEDDGFRVDGAVLCPDCGEFAP